MSTASRPAPLTLTHWLILIIAAIGFAFDIYELLMMQFVLRPAIEELTGAKLGTPEFAQWRQWLMWLPLVLGGAVGLVGGYLTDTLGRRRMLTWSILLYALSAFLAGFSTNIYMLLVLRCLTLVGVCIEFVAAIAWLAELFPEPKRREAALGYTQAFSSIGGLLAAVVFSFLVEYRLHLPAIAIPESLTGWIGQISAAGQHAPWRYMLMSGVVPALPLIIIRPFLPESPVWQQKKLAGTLKRPSFAEIFRPDLRLTTIITTLMVACGYGVALGCIQQVPQMVQAIPEMPERVRAEKSRLEEEIATLKRAEPGQPTPPRLAVLQKELAAVGSTTASATAASLGKIQETGGLVGRFLLAYLAIVIVGRRTLLRLFVLPGLIIVPAVFGFGVTHSFDLFYWGMFLVGLFTVSQFSFWGNYLPTAYPVHLRGTGESFAANVGGRILGTSAVLLTTFIEGSLSPDLAPATRLAYAAAWVAGGLYLLNLLLSFFLPEPKVGDE